MAANSHFRILYRGEPVAGFETAASVVLIAAAKVTLLAQADRPDSGGACQLLVDQGDRVRVETIDGCTAADCRETHHVGSGTLSRSEGPRAAFRLAGSGHVRDARPLPDQQHGAGYADASALDDRHPKAPSSGFDAATAPTRWRSARLTMLPHAGEFTPAKPGQYHSDTIRPGREALRTAVVNILLGETGAERLPDELNGYHQRVRIDGRLLSITIVDSEPDVYVAMESGKEEPELMTRIASRLDAAFATGKYDAAFEIKGKE
jgi:hypothetical protein